MMKDSLIHALHVSLALLIIAVAENVYVHTDYSGASPSSLGLRRLERDLTRRMDGVTAGQISMQD